MVYRERKNIRLKGYDYAHPGYYFVTLCTQNKAHLFGCVNAFVGADSISAHASGLVECDNSAKTKVLLNAGGEMIYMMYQNIQLEFLNIVLHDYVVMPNHLHGIIQIVENNPDAGKKASLADILQSFKRSTTLKYIEGVKNGIYEPFETRVWQRGYYDHIIRNDDEMMKIQQYIIDNPVKWADDEYY